MARYAIYARRSSPGEEDKNYSIEDQIRDSQRWNEPLGYTLVQTYVDPGAKSWTLNRPAFNEMMADAKAGLFDILVVGRYDRFSRSQDQQAVAIYQLETYGVKVMSATQPVPDGVLGTFMRNTYAFGAELELYNIRERTVGGRKARVRNGKILAAPHPLYGYVWADPHEPRGKSRYIPDPETAPVVQRIYTLVFSGMKMRAVAALLEQEVIPTPGQVLQVRGQLPRGRTCSSIWRLSTLNRILSDPAYIGKHSGWRREVRTIVVTDPLTGEQIERKRPVERAADHPDRIFFSEAVCPPLVDEDLFLCVQEILTQNRQQAYRNMSDPEAALLRAGFAMCGYCGRRMQPKFVKSNNHYRYFCGSERDTKSAGARCEGRAFSIQASELDEMVWKWFMQAFEQPDVLRKQVQQWKLAQEASQALEHDRLRAVEGAMKKVEARKRNHMISAGEAEDEEIRAEFTLLAKEAARQARELAREHKRLSTVLNHHKKFQGKAKSLVSLGASALDRLQSASYEDKRIALHAFKVQVKVWRKEHIPPLEITWGFDRLHERWEQEWLQASDRF
jgi:site-specific DNA recombinase